MKCDEDLEVVIPTIRARYAKGLKGARMECDKKFTYKKMVQLKEIGLLTQYHE